MRDARLGEFLTLVRDEVLLEPDTVYPTAGILSYGKGLFARPPILGSQTSYKSYFRLAADDFVYSKLFAWEGALAVVGEAFDGLFVSQEFPTFKVDRRLALPRYVALLCRREQTWDAVRAGESGMGGRRKRVHPSRLLEVVVPLPSIETQRRIVDVIASCDEAFDKIRGGQTSVTRLRSALLTELLAAHEDWVTTPLREVADVRLGKMLSRPAREHPERSPYLRNANVQWYELRLDDLREMHFSDDEKREFSLKAGDVLVCEGGEVGRCAVLEEDLEGVFFQKALHRVRCGPRLHPSFLAHVLRHSAMTGGFADLATQSTIQHLTKEKLEQLVLQLPPIDEQARIVDVLRGVDRHTAALQALNSRTTRLRAALLEGLVTGTREIPKSYDSLLEEAS